MARGSGKKSNDGQREELSKAKTASTVEPEPSDLPGQRMLAKGTFSHTQVEYHKGPLPPARELRELEEVVPGGARLVLDQFVKQTDHRIEMEKIAIWHQIYRSWGGLVLGFILAVAVVGGGVYAIVEGHDWAGGTIITAAITALGGAFVYGSKQQTEEQTAKKQMMRRE